MTVAARVALLMSYYGPDQHSREFVGRALDSVPLEALVYIRHVCARQGRPELAAAVKRCKATVFRSETADYEIQAATWNRLAWQALGDGAATYLGCFNADDYWLPGGLTWLQTVLDLNRELVLAYGDYVRHSEAGEHTDCTGNVLPPSSPIEESPVPGPFAIFRADAARKVMRSDGRLWDESYEVCADHDLWIRLRAVGRFGWYSKPVGMFLDRASSLSRRVPGRMAAERLRLRAGVRSVAGA